jgi:hypothetical protein
MTAPTPLDLHSASFPPAGSRGVARNSSDISRIQELRGYSYPAGWHRVAKKANYCPDR